MSRVLALFAILPWAWSVLVAVLDRRHRLSLDDVEPLSAGPLVSVVVPARDEERGIRIALTSLATQEYGPLEVIVVDDESSDATATEARAAATDRVQVLRGKPVPAGWVGKSWACQQGYERARGEWLLFTDADVRHAPDTVGRALALVQRLGAEGPDAPPGARDGRAGRADGATGRRGADPLLRRAGPLRPLAPHAGRDRRRRLHPRLPRRVRGGRRARRDAPRARRRPDARRAAQGRRDAAAARLLGRPGAGAHVRRRAGDAPRLAQEHLGRAGRGVARRGLRPGGGRHRLRRRADGRTGSWPSLGGPRQG